MGLDPQLRARDPILYIYIYIYVYIHTFIHTYIHVHIYVYANICVCIYNPRAAECAERLNSDVPPLPLCNLKWQNTCIFATSNRHVFMKLCFSELWEKTQQLNMPQYVQEWFFMVVSLCWDILKQKGACGRYGNTKINVKCSVAQGRDDICDD